MGGFGFELFFDVFLVLGEIGRFIEATSVRISQPRAPQDPRGVPGSGKRRVFMENSIPRVTEARTPLKQSKKMDSYSTPVNSAPVSARMAPRTQ